MDPRDERVVGVATQPGPIRGPRPEREQGGPPEGHREASTDRDTTRREAGENR
jgi:hypothetical protein